MSKMTTLKHSYECLFYLFWSGKLNGIREEVQKQTEREMMLRTIDPFTILMKI